MARYTMIIYVKKLSDSWVMPYVPASSALSFGENQDMDSWQTDTMTYITPQTVKPIEFCWDGIFPCQKRSWTENGFVPKPEEFRSWIRKHRKERDVFHVVITSPSGKECINGNYHISNFDAQLMQNCDYHMSISFQHSAQVK